MPLNKQEEMLEEVAGDALLTIRRRFPAYRISLELSEDILYLPMEPMLIKQVMVNLLTNSICYGREGGQTRVRFRDMLDKILIEVEDSGVGIAKEDIPRVFERFYRTDASRNSAQGGSGIGLSIVKKIVEDHGGYVWATAKEGEGTCMHFVLRKYIELQPGGTK